MKSVILEPYSVYLAAGRHFSLWIADTGQVWSRACDSLPHQDPPYLFRSSRHGIIRNPSLLCSVLLCRCLWQYHERSTSALGVLASQVWAAMPGFVEVLTRMTVLFATQDRLGRAVIINSVSRWLTWQRFISCLQKPAHRANMFLYFHMQRQTWAHRRHIQNINSCKNVFRHGPS